MKFAIAAAFAVFMSGAPTAASAQPDVSVSAQSKKVAQGYGRSCVRLCKARHGNGSRNAYSMCMSKCVRQ